MAVRRPITPLLAWLIGLTLVALLLIGWATNFI